MLPGSKNVPFKASNGRSNTVGGTVTAGVTNALKTVAITNTTTITTTTTSALSTSTSTSTSTASTAMKLNRTDGVMIGRQHQMMTTATAAPTTIATTIATATATTVVTTKSSNNNDNNKISASGSSANTSTHRRENSIPKHHQSLHHNHQNQNQQQHHHQHYQLTKKDVRKYQYAKPQTKAPPPLPMQSPQSGVNSPDAPDTTNDDDIFGIHNDNHSPSDSNDVDDVDGDNVLVYYDGNLIAGSLRALIMHMVPTNDYYPDRLFVFAFLLSARLFVRPHELLTHISNIWERQQEKQQQHLQQMGPCSGDDVDACRKFLHLSLSGQGSCSPHLPRRSASEAPPPPLLGSDPVSGSGSGSGSGLTPHLLASTHNCIRLLAEWIETFPYDFRDERLMQQVRILARKCVYIDHALGKQVSRMLQLLVQRLAALEVYEEFLQSLIVANSETVIVHPSQLHAHYSTSAAAAYTATSAAAAAAAATAAATSASSSSGGGVNATSSTTVGNAYYLQGKLSVPPSSSSSSSAAHHNNSTGHGLGNAIAASATATSTTPAPSSAVISESQTNSSSSSSSSDIFGLIDLCPSCARLAHQLTAIELMRLSHIGPEEFVQAFAKEYQQNINHSSGASGSSSSSGSGSTTGGGGGNAYRNALNDMKKTRNLESYVEWFNRLSYLTATEIVKYPKKKQRVRVIEYWIETARECFNIGNFNSLMAIIAGLNLEPISRLKKTWSKVQQAKFSVLEHQMDPTSNFNSYRSTLKAAMWRSEGATDERERIIIPFFSLFVKDLYFLNEGCSNRLPNNHINFEKCSQLAKQIMEFNEWKKVTCPYEKLPIVIAYLQNSPVLNENTLSMASFECEPPENHEEKGRYKTVKAETKQQLLQQLQEQQQLQQQQQQQQHHHHH